MLEEATAKMSEVHADGEDAKWRVQLRHKLNKIRKRALVDYVDRRDNHNCDANEVVVYDEVDGKLERGLPSECKEAAKPFRIISGKARSWMDKWNSCGDGANRANMRTRLWKKLQAARKIAYIAVGCNI